MAAAAAASAAGPADEVEAVFYYTASCHRPTTVTHSLTVRHPPTEQTSPNLHLRATLTNASLGRRALTLHADWARRTAAVAAAALALRGILPEVTSAVV